MIQCLKEEKFQNNYLEALESFKQNRQIIQQKIRGLAMFFGTLQRMLHLLLTNTEVKITDETHKKVKVC